jgi:hypothetical protein
MQERIFKPSKFFYRSVFIWVYVVLYIVVLTFFPGIMQVGSIGAAIFLFIIMSLLCVPGVMIFINYYRHSINREFILRYETISMRNVVTNEIVEIYSPDIERIELVEVGRGSRAPWIFFSYIRFIDKNGKQIVVTMFFLTIDQIWIDSLSRRIDNKKMQRITTMLPLIR